MARLIRLAEVEHKTGLSRSTIYRLLSADAFPAAIALTEGCKRWSEESVEEWILAKIKEARAPD